MRHATEEHEKLHKPDWVAQRLRVHVSCVHRWMRTGKIAFVELPGGRKLIPDSEYRRITTPKVTGQRAIPTIREGNARHQAAVEVLRRAGIKV